MIPALLLACGAPEPVGSAPLDPALEPGRISVERLRPALGERVRVDLPYAGPWPALLDWEGVDEVDGVTAWVTVASLGEHWVQVGQTRALLDVQPARNRPELDPVPVLKRPLPDAGHACFDARFPTLAGAWVVGCEHGLVAKAWHLQDGREQELAFAVSDPGVGPGVLSAPGVGTWWLDEGRFEAARPNPVDPSAPAGVGGARVALVDAETVHWMPPAATERWKLPARPASWYAPAVSGETVAWVDRRDSAWTGLDLYRLDEAGRAVVLVRAPGDQRHIAASEHWVGWIESDAVVVEDLRTGERRRYMADAHSARGLSLWGPVACWEQWNGQDVDALCSDGMFAGGAGHQRRPARHGAWLFYMDGKRPMVATAQSLVWDDNHPRAVPLGPREGRLDAYRGAWVPDGVDYDLPELDGAWELQVWEDGGWVSRGPWTVDLPVRAADAVRLVPAP